MIILGIETSCDETALSLIEASGTKDTPEIKVLANLVHSQVEIHKEYGGVFPALAKREHSQNLLPLFKKLLTEAGFGNSKSEILNPKQILDSRFSIIDSILDREPELLKQFLEFLPNIEKPPIDAIAVTEGPGLEPALWVGVNFARALAAVWDIPILPINHMEGHIVSALLRDAETADLRGLDPGSRTSQTRFTTGHGAEQRGNNATNYQLQTINFPALALLISGGHTELVLIKDWFDYEIVGETLDDAVGEAFDKVARILGLPYPGGPQISALAEKSRAEISQINADKNADERGYGISVNLRNHPRSSAFHFPRPMKNSGDLNFSFSGLKTAVLYAVKNIPTLTNEIIMEVAREFEDAATESLTFKTEKAVETYGIKTLIVGGGVSANIHIRRELKKMAARHSLDFFVSTPEIATDNALMIALAAGMRKIFGARFADNGKSGALKAVGNLRLSA